eukprot:TRINITY_DN2575_c0_g2_i3.p2 TRINITY_DN2575_c0_g2~~TRINITY_DN2575_c0_g2_i3.p2  ORF type:complete len:201 (+),score=56.98 TRINITY_DN2575_c0_g2_i3:64-666(+)
MCIRDRSSRVHGDYFNYCEMKSYYNPPKSSYGCCDIAYMILAIVYILIHIGLIGFFLNVGGGIGVLIFVLSGSRIAIAVTLLLRKYNKQTDTNCFLTTMCIIVLLLDILEAALVILLSISYWSTVTLIEDIVVGTDVIILSILISLGSVFCPQQTFISGPSYLPYYSYAAIVPSISYRTCLLYTSPSPRDQRGSRMPSSA